MHTTTFNVAPLGRGDETADVLEGRNGDDPSMSRPLVGAMRRWEAIMDKAPREPSMSRPLVGAMRLDPLPLLQAPLTPFNVAPLGRGDET